MKRRFIVFALIFGLAAPAVVGGPWKNSRIFIAMFEAAVPEKVDGHLEAVFLGSVKLSRTGPEMPARVTCTSRIAWRCVELEPVACIVVAEGHWEIEPPDDTGRLPVTINQFKIRKKCH